MLQSEALSRKLEGYVNKEITLALDRQKYFRASLRFIIPVTLDGGHLLEELDSLQTTDLTDRDNVRSLVSIIRRDQQRRQRDGE